jgi:hypothetical protein
VSPSCGDLDPFFDGELATEAAAAFRDHLGGCARCQRALRGRMLEAVVVATPRHQGEIPEAVALPSRPRARWWTAPVIAVAAAAALVLWWRARTSGEEAMRAPAVAEPAGGGEAVALALRPERGIDVRFSAPELDGYRPKAPVMRGAQGAREDVGLQRLAALERRGDLHALVGAYAINGELDRASREAQRLPASAAALSDRAALALLDPDSRPDPRPDSRPDPRPDSRPDPRPDPRPDSRPDPRPDSQKERASAERALSLAAQARRLAPDLEPAAWNEAVALEQLRLVLAAADAFDELGRRGTGGWAAEAKERAVRLRGDHAAELARWKALQDAADAMARGGSPMALDQAARAPSVAQKALHVAIAATADRDRLGALAPLAAALELAPELARIRASDLARRQALAGRFAAALGRPDLPALRAVRAEARAAGIADIARAAALAIEDAGVTAEDVAELERLPAAGPWWRLVAAERLAFFLTYRSRSYAGADLAARDAVLSCRPGAGAPDLYWCPRILRTVAAANAEIGGVDRAYELVDEARRLADLAGERREEAAVFSVLGQIAAARTSDLIDPSAVSAAYLRESDLRIDNCRSRLYRLDFPARAALGHHRFAEAERLLADADRINQTQCKDVRYNAEEVRLRLILQRPAAARIDLTGLRPAPRAEPAGAPPRDSLTRIDELAGHLQQIEQSFPDLDAGRRLYGEYLLARARLAADGEPRVAALEGVLARAAALPDEGYPHAIRVGANSALAEHAARTGAAERALAAIAARMGAQLEAGCAVGVNHDDRVTIVVRGPDGRAEAAIREVPEGQRVLDAQALIPAALRQRLAGCERVDVLATGPYLGVPGLLGPQVRWAYRASPRRRTEPLRLEDQVVVTDVQAPASLRLPPLRRMTLPAARTVEGAAATPDGVLRAIADAQLAVINAHGVTDANEPAAASLVLSPDPKQKGSYWLTADRVRQARLSRAPVIILAACHAGRVQVSTEPWSLASSFLLAGARAVIAPTTEIPDEDANVVFESIIGRMRSGASPEQAVASEREARGGRSPWLANVVVFQ